MNSTGLTSITPTGALGKLTQLTYGALAPGNITTNLMTAGITGEVKHGVAIPCEAAIADGVPPKTDG